MTEIIEEEVEETIEEEVGGEDLISPPPEDALSGDEAELSPPAVPVVDKETPPAEGVPRFELTEEDREPIRDEDTSQSIEEGAEYELVDGGQIRRIDQASLIQLAQQGLNMSQLMQADPELATLVRDHVYNRRSGHTTGRLPATGGEKKEELPFEVKPITDYENEVDWLRAHLSEVRKSTPAPVPRPRPVLPGRAPVQGGINPGMQMLMSHDPQNFRRVAPKLGAYAQRLALQDWQAIDRDPALLLQFYDFVKDQEVSRQTAEAPARGKPAQPGFRVSSGGVGKPQPVSEKDPWKIPDKEFQAVLDAAK